MGDSLISQMSSGWSLELVVPLISGCVGIVLLIRSRRHLLGTTLVAPASWALISWITVTVLQTITTGWELRSPATWNYLAAATTLCPTMAVLGAKRPQDRGWQFIVASLWIVLALPAAQDLAFAPGGGFELHPAWAWFLALLIALGLLNYLPTRFAFSAVLIALAQIILLEAQLPDLGMKLSGYHPFAIPLLTIGLVIACWRARSGIHRQGWNGAWLDFRDAFGSVWALRVAERMNQAARTHHWPARFRWQRIEPVDAPGKDERASSVQPLNDEMELSFRTLLRRFVSPAWIGERLGEASAADHPHSVDAG